MNTRPAGHLTLVIFGLYCATAAAQTSEKKESDEKTRDTVSHELGHALDRQKAKRTAPGERVMQPKYGSGQEKSDPDKSGRVKVTFPAMDGSSKHRRGNPDRPVMTGRAPNPQTSGGSIPTETLSLNFEKVRVASVRVSERLRHKNRLLVRGTDNRAYLVPDGKYRNKTRGEVKVVNGRLRYGDITLKRGLTTNSIPKASGDTVIKGSKTGENAPSGSQTTPSQTKVIMMGAAESDGRYDGPGGAWIEIKGGEIAVVGGQLERQVGR